MTVGDLITGLFQGGIAVFFVAWVIRIARPKPPSSASVERRVAPDAPSDRVELVIVYPNKATARVGRWFLLDQEIRLTKTSPLERRATIAEGVHILTAKIGLQKHQFLVDCAAKGRYELLPTLDRFFGGLANELKVIATLPPAAREPEPTSTPARKTEMDRTLAIALAEANQFLRYRAASRAKVDSQAKLMDALLTGSDAPPVQATLLRAVDHNAEYPWLVVKSGSYQDMAALRKYSAFEPTFKMLFGDQPFSVIWADHIAENCPGPGEMVTALGRERYAAIAAELRGGKYVVERQLGAR